jgi:hypothetical protein
MTIVKVKARFMASNHIAPRFEGAIRITETDFYRGINTPELIADQSLARDARFLLDNGYQAPRTIRIGAKAGF